MQGNIMKKLLAQCEVVDFYLHKIEQYLGRKHQNILHKSSASSCGDSMYSGSPKSTLSDRIQTIEEDDKKFDEEIGGFERAVRSREAGSSTAASSIKVEQEQRLSTQSVLDLEEDNVLFKDFTEPDLMKTGYLIPLKCGHNGQLSVQEKTIYEIHLTNAGFIQEQETHRSSELDES